MAWYEGTYACGHEGRVNIIGPQKDRGYKKERAFSRLCPDCWQKERDEKIKKSNVESAELSKEYGFPDLTGTEKQTAWANTIRMELYKEINDKLDRIRESQKEKFSISHQIPKESCPCESLDGTLAPVVTSYTLLSTLRVIHLYLFPFANCDHAIL